MRIVSGSTMKKANITVMAAAGTMLLVASFMKTHQMVTEPIVSEGFWESWEFFLVQIPLEIGLGVWLISGLFRKGAWLGGLLAFGLFIGVTGYKWIGGAESCGCFGRVHVEPWKTLWFIDVPFFVLLLVFRPKGVKLLPPPWPSAKHFFGVAVPTLLVIGGIVPFMVLNKQVKPDYEEEWTKPPPVIPDSNATTTVEPEPVAEVWEWLGQIDVSESLREGIWIVLFYHSDCSDCREAIPVYEQMNDDLGGGEDTMRIAFIELPPYGDPGDSPVPDDSKCLQGRFIGEEVLVMTPFVVVTIDGAVVNVWEGKAPVLDEILEAVFSAQ